MLSLLMKLQKCLDKKISCGPDFEYMKCLREGFSLMVCDLYIYLFPELVSTRKSLALLIPLSQGLKLLDLLQLAAEEKEILGGP